jgi:hypothetical protein
MSEDVENAIRHIRKDALGLAEKVVLFIAEGFPDLDGLDKAIVYRIHQACVTMYGIGYVEGMRDRE